jgi:transglutaminase-like putative cysteine protease
MPTADRRTAPGATATAAGRAVTAPAAVGRVDGRRRLSVLRLVQLVLVGSLAVLAGGQFSRVFGWSPILGPVVAAGAVAVGVAALTTGWARRGALVAVVAAIAGFVVLVTVMVLRDTAVAGVLPGAATLRDLGDGLQNGWARILSTTVPAGAEPSMVLVPVAITWWSGWAAAELVLRARSAWVPLVPLVVAYTAAFAFGIPAGSTSPALTGLVVAGAFLLVVLRTDDRPGVQADRANNRRTDERPVGAAGSTPAAEPRPRLDARSRRRLAGLPVVALVAVVATALGPHLPVRGEPVDPRSYRTVSPPERAVLNPIDQVQGRLARPDDRMFTVRFEGETRPDRLPQVVLDRYDGRTWSAGGRYVSTGRQLPPPDAPPTRPSQVVQDIRIQGLDGIWLPAAARPVEVTGTDFQFDPDHGVLVSPAPELADLRYRVVSDVARPTEEQLAAASFAPAPAALDLPSPIPESIIDAAQNMEPSTVGALERARSLETYLQARVKTPENVADAPTGHAYGNLTHLLNEEASGFEGTSEQFATLFAVLARVNGIPARVVAGFMLPTEPTPEGVYEVRSGDAHVWPELLFEGVGWVPFDPSPNAAAEAREEEREQAGSDRPVDEPVVVDVPSTTTPSTRDRAAAGTGGGVDWRWALLLIPMSIVGALSIPVLLKRRRRRRGRRGRPEQRVGAAWSDVVDRMVETRVDVPVSASATDVVAAGRQAFGPDPAAHLDPLAGLVNEALFGRRAPDEAMAERAWHHADGFRRALTARLGLGRRLRAAFDPRPLTRRR